MKKDRHYSRRWLLLPENSLQEGKFFPLEDVKMAHLRKVLRLEWEETVCVLNGKGKVYEAVFTQLGKAGGVQVGRMLKDDPEDIPIVLYIGLAKNQTMEWLIEKATECGVSAVVPFIASRSVVKPGQGEESKYAKRWQSIADASIEQSERLWRPLIHAPRRWNEIIHELTNDEAGNCVVFSSEMRDQASENIHLTHAWQSLRRNKQKKLSIVIGPEGGFSGPELQEFKDQGFELLSLGSSVYRVETAVILALSLAQWARKIDV